MEQQNLKLCTINQIIREIEKFDKNLKEHLIRVSIYAEKLADLMCLEREKIIKIVEGSLLHDIGKILINPSILNKTTELTKDEFYIIKNHTILGLVLLQEKNVIIENIILFHHEKWNGDGYPLGLKAKDIPIEARIVSLVDFYDALTSKRVYRDPVSHKDALNMIKKESGKSFEPDIVAMFEIFEKEFEYIKKYKICKT